MTQPYAVWLRNTIEAATPFTRQIEILPHVEHLAQVCRQQIRDASTVSVQRLYGQMLRDFEDLIKQYANAA